MSSGVGNNFEDTSSPAFSFIVCEPGKENLVIEKLQKLKPVKEIHRTHGAYDLLVKLEKMPETRLSDVMRSEILTMNEVQSVLNLTST